MKAIILAAGRGSRMGNLTTDHPKGMIPVNGKTLLEWQMEALRKAGIHDIYIVRGYMGHAIPYSAVKYLENSQWESTNMVSSLLVASDLLASDACVISYADIIYTDEAVIKLINGMGDLRITYDENWLELWSKRFANPLSDAETFRLSRDGTLLEIGKKTISIEDIQGQYMGLLYFEPTGWQKIISLLSNKSADEIRTLDMTTLLSTVIVNHKVHAVKVSDPWFEFDSLHDLQIFTGLSYE